MHRRTAIRVIGSAIALVALGGCSTTTGGRPAVATTTSDTAPDESTTTNPTTPASFMPPAPPTSSSPTNSASPSTPESTTTEASTNSGPPDLSGGVTGTITWNTGSLPPPYNYTWTAKFTASSGSFTLRTNYATGEQSWSQDFIVTHESMAALTDGLTAAGVGVEGPPSAEHLVGGPTGSYQLTTADGAQLHASLGDSSATSTELGRISDAVEEFVGPAAWNTVMDDYQKWKSEQH